MSQIFAWKPPEIGKVDTSSQYLHKTVKIKKPLLYIRNIPHYAETTPSVFYNTYSLLHPKSTAELHSFVNSCSGCLTPQTLVTPVRVSYIPAGTQLTVIDEFIYYSQTNIHVLLVKDEKGIISEIKHITFKRLLDSSYLHPSHTSSTVKSFLKVMDEWQKNGSGFIRYTPNRIVKPRPITPFIEAFKLNDELVWKQHHELSPSIMLKPKTEDALVTLYFFMKEWGHHRGYFEYLGHDPTLRTVSPPYLDTTEKKTRVPRQ